MSSKTRVRGGARRSNDGYYNILCLGHASCGERFSWWKTDLLRSYGCSSLEELAVENYIAMIDSAREMMRVDNERVRRTRQRAVLAPGVGEQPDPGGARCSEKWLGNIE